jgi:hypothetical protein
VGAALLPAMAFGGLAAARAFIYLGAGACCSCAWVCCVLLLADEATWSPAAAADAAATQRACDASQHTPSPARLVALIHLMLCCCRVLTRRVTHTHTHIHACGRSRGGRAAGAGGREE